MRGRHSPLPLLLLAWAAGCQSNPVGRDAPVPAAAGRADLPPADSARVCLRTARDLERQGYFPDAIAQYERARSFDPSGAGPVATRRLAVLYGRAGDPVRAAAEYATALRATPADPLLLNDAGYFHLSQGDAVAAEPLFRRSLAADPGYARAWVNLGLALADQGRPEDGYAAFQKVLPPAQARADVGVALARRGRYREAEASLKDALGQDATLPQAQVALRWVEDQLHPPATRPADAGDPDGGGT